MLNKFDQVWLFRMGYQVAHAEAQGFAQQIGWAHNKADLKSSGRVLGLPSDAVPKKGQAPKVMIWKFLDTFNVLSCLGNQALGRTNMN